MLFHTIICFTSMLGKIIRVKRGREEESKDTLVVEAPEKRVATMDAVNEELSKMTLKEGENEAARPPMFELKRVVTNRYRYKRIETTTNADFEDWCTEKFESMAAEVIPRYSRKRARFQINYNTNVASHLQVWNGALG